MRGSNGSQTESGSGVPPTITPGGCRGSSGREGKAPMGRCCSSERIGRGQSSRKKTQNRIGQNTWEGSTDQMSLHLRPGSRTRGRWVICHPVRSIWNIGVEFLFHLRGFWLMMPCLGHPECWCSITPSRLQAQKVLTEHHCTRLWAWRVLSWSYSWCVCSSRNVALAETKEPSFSDGTPYLGPLLPRGSMEGFILMLCRISSRCVLPWVKGV